ncbi:MAG: hypothetical protein ACKO14_09085, partial [Armatimonadota bacterium]
DLRNPPCVGFLLCGSRKNSAMTKEQTNQPEMKHTNWMQIEVDYRAGIKTLRQIAEENGISHQAIDKRAKKEEWMHDLTAKIQAKANVLNCNAK